MSLIISTLMSIGDRHDLTRLTGVAIPGPRRGGFAPRALLEVASTRAAVALSQMWIPIVAADARQFGEYCIYRVTIERRRRSPGQRLWHIQVLRAQTPWEAQEHGLKRAVEGALVALDEALALGAPWKRLEQRPRESGCIRWLRAETNEVGVRERKLLCLRGKP